MKRFTKSQIAVCLLAAVSGVQIAKADQLADVKARGTLVCGVLSSAAPFGFQDPTSRDLVGYDIDFCKGVAKELGVKPELKVLSLDARIPELTQGRVDVIAAALGFNPQRAQQIAFSDTYFASNQVIATKSAGPNKALRDLEGKRISTVKGSSNIPMVQHALPTAQIVSYDDPPSAFMALIQGKVDGYVLSESLMHRFIDKLGENANTIAILSPPVGREYWGIGMKKGESKLIAAVNAALVNMQKSGESQKIFENWLGTGSTFKMKRDFVTAPIPG